MWLLGSIKLKLKLKILDLSLVQNIKSQRRHILCFTSKQIICI